MRVKTLVFECAHHEEYGSNGWKLRGQPNADPLGGMAVAHDCLEHSFGGSMDVEEELRALGASLYVREYTVNMHSLGANVSADLPDVMRHISHEGHPLSDPGRTYPCAGEDEIDNCFEEFQKNLKDESDLSISEEEMKRMRGWLRIGYRQAVRRWKGMGGLRWLFDEIQNQADRYLKHAELGDLLFVRLTFSRALLTDARTVLGYVGCPRQDAEDACTLARLIGTSRTEFRKEWL